MPKKDDDDDAGKINNPSDQVLGKRQRGHSACQQCRIRKVKCDGQYPKCSGCESTGAECVYTKPKKRGFPPGYMQKLESYVDDLERLLGAYIHQYGEAPSLRCQDPHKVWKSSKQYTALKKQHGTTGSGASKDESDSDNARERVKESINETFNKQLKTPPSEVELSLVGTSHLLDTYFCLIHSWLPLLNKADLTRLAHSKTHQASTDETMELHCVLKLASQFSTKQYNVFGDFGARIANYASTAILELDSSDTKHVTRVQTLLLMSLVHYNEERLYTAWVMVGIAVRMAMRSGLNQDDDSAHKRAWISCCIIDTLISGHVSKVPHISHDDFEIDAIPEDGLEEWELWKPIENNTTSLSWMPEPSRSLSVFNAFFRLVKSINKFVSQVNHPALDLKAAVERTMIYTELASSLQLWRRNLTEHCHLGHLDSLLDSHMTPQRANLFLTFLTANSLLHLSNDPHVFVYNSDVQFLFSKQQLPIAITKLLLNLQSSGLVSSSPFFAFHVSTTLSLIQKFELEKVLVDGKSVFQVFVDNGWVKPRVMDNVNDMANGFEDSELKSQQESQQPFGDVDIEGNPDQAVKNVPESQQPQPHEPQMPDINLDDIVMSDLFNQQHQESMPEFLYNLGIF